MRVRYWLAWDRYCGHIRGCNRAYAESLRSVSCAGSCSGPSPNSLALLPQRCIGVALQGEGTGAVAKKRVDEWNTASPEVTRRSIRGWDRDGSGANGERDLVTVRPKLNRVLITTPLTGQDNSRPSAKIVDANHSIADLRLRARLEEADRGERMVMVAPRKQSSGD